MSGEDYDCFDGKYNATLIRTAMLRISVRVGIRYVYSTKASLMRFVSFVLV